MGKFRIGDKVVCTDSSATISLKIGHEYTVRESGVDMVILEDIEGAWFTYRFELVERLTDAVKEKKCSCGQVDLIDGRAILKDGAVHTTTPCFQVHDTAAVRPNLLAALGKDPKSDTGASKNDKEKIDVSLIPYIAIQAEAKAFMVGAKKYGRYNYCKGHSASQLVAAAQRHLLAWFEGEENDPQDGQPHLGSVRACMAMLLRQQELGTLKDDRFKKETKE